MFLNSISKFWLWFDFVFFIFVVIVTFITHSKKFLMNTRNLIALIPSLKLAMS